MDQEVRSPSIIAPYVLRKVAKSSPMPYTWLVAAMNSEMVATPLCGR